MTRKNSDFTVQTGAGKCGPCFEWTKLFLVACFRNGKLPLWCVGSCRLYPVDVGMLSDSTNASPVQEVSWVIPSCFSHLMLAAIYCIICASIDPMLCSVLLMRWKSFPQTWQSSRYHASVMTGSNEWEGRGKLPRFALLCFCFIWRSKIWEFSLNQCFWNCVSARFLLLAPPLAPWAPREFLGFEFSRTWDTFLNEFVLNNFCVFFLLLGSPGWFASLACLGAWICQNMKLSFNRCF